MASKKEKKGEQLVVNQIVIQAPQRRVYNVGDWRSAMRSADLGIVRYLYNLFDDILMDSVLNDAIQKRTDAVLNTKISFVDKKGDEHEEITNLINSSTGENLLKCILKQRFFGRSGFEISLSNGFECREIKPKYIDLQNQKILLNDLGDKSISYEGNDQILILGKPLDYGLILKATPYAIYKRGGFGDYAQWIELFGMPQRIGKYNTYDPQSRQLLEQAFKEAGAAPYIIIPKESEIETREGNTGSGSSYNEFRQACNEEILISILGQTLTTIQGERGARSLGEVHLDVEKSKHESDIRFVERVLNERVCPMFEARGFNLKGGRFVFPQNITPLTVSEIINLSEVIKIPASFIYSKYGIPIPQEDETIARKKTQEVIDVIQETPKGTKKIRNVDKKSFWYRMWNFFAGAPQVGATLSGVALTLKDAKTLDERVIARTPHNNGFDTELFEYLSNDLISAFRKGWNEMKPQMADKVTLALEYSIQDDALKMAMEMNLYRFSAAKTLAEVQELNQIFRESNSYSEFEKQAKLVCAKFNKQWQRTEYDTALLSAQSASNYQRLIREAETFPYWQYRTVHDGRVRPSHKLLDGVVLPAGDSLWNEIFPPNGWNCRCRVKPLLAGEFKGSIAEQKRKVDEFKKTDDWSNAEVDGWAINRAKQGLVFTENQTYVNIFSNTSKQVLNSLTHVDYGLLSIEECIEKATEKMPIYEGTATEWLQEHPYLIDFWDRKILFDEKEFKVHTTKKSYIKQGRIKLLSAVIDVVKSPDEIWINDFKKEMDNVIFIKYFDRKAISVVCRLKDLSYKIHSWFEIALHSNSYKNPKSQYRRGLLVKK